METNTSGEDGEDDAEDHVSETGYYHPAFENILKSATYRFTEKEKKGELEADKLLNIRRKTQDLARADDEKVNSEDTDMAAGDNTKITMEYQKPEQYSIKTLETHKIYYHSETLHTAGDFTQKAAPDRSPQQKPSRESQTKLTLGTPGLKSSSVCECSLDISVAELLPSQENTELQGSPLKKSFTGIGLKKLSGKKHKGKREESKSGEEVEVIQHLPEQTVSPSKGGRISTWKSFKRLITRREGSKTRMEEKTGDTVVGCSLEHSTSDGKPGKDEPWVRTAVHKLGEAEGSAAFDSEQHITSIGIRGPSATDRAEVLENTQVDHQLPVKYEVIQSKAEELQQSGLVKTATLVVTAEIHATAENTKAAPDRSPQQQKPSRESQTKLTLGTPGLKSPSVCECSLDISVAELLPSQEKTELQGSPLKKFLTGIGLKKLSGKKHKGKREESKSGEEVEVIQHLPEQTESPSKGGRISTWKSFKRLITRRKGSKTRMEEKTGDAVVGSSLEHLTSDGKPGKDESWVSFRKLMPGRRKKKSDGKPGQSHFKQAREDRAETMDEGSDIPAVVALPEYEAAEQEKSEAQQVKDVEAMREEISEEERKELPVTETAVEETREECLPAGQIAVQDKTEDETSSLGLTADHLVQPEGEAKTLTVAPECLEAVVALVPVKPERQDEIPDLDSEDQSCSKVAPSRAPVEREEEEGDAVLPGAKSTEITVTEVPLQSERETCALPGAETGSEAAADAERNVSKGAGRHTTAKASVPVLEPEDKEKTAETPSQSHETEDGKTEDAVLKNETCLDSDTTVTEVPPQVQADSPSAVASTRPDIPESGSAVLADISPEQDERPSSLAESEAVGKEEELLEPSTSQEFQEEDKRIEQVMEGPQEAAECGKQEAVRGDECSSAVQQEVMAVQEEGSGSAFLQAGDLEALKVPVAAAAVEEQVTAETVTPADTTAQTVQPLATAPEETACEEVPVTAVECSGCGTAELGRAEAPEPQVTPASVNGISEEQESPQSSGQPEHNGVPLSDSLCLNHAKIEQDVVQPLTVESQSPKIVLNAFQTAVRCLPEYEAAEQEKSEAQQVKDVEAMREEISEEERKELPVTETAVEETREECLPAGQIAVQDKTEDETSSLGLTADHLVQPEGEAKTLTVAPECLEAVVALVPVKPERQDEIPDLDSEDQSCSKVAPSRAPVEREEEEGDAVLPGAKSTEITVTEVPLQSERETCALPGAETGSEAAADAERNVSKGAGRHTTAKASVPVLEPQYKEKTAETPSQSDETENGKTEDAVLKTETCLDSDTTVTEVPPQVQADSPSAVASTRPDIPESGSAVLTDISPEQDERPSSLAESEAVGKEEELLEPSTSQEFQEEDKRIEQVMEGPQEAAECGKQEPVRGDECSSAVQQEVMAVQEEGSGSAFVQAGDLEALKVPVAAAGVEEQVTAETVTPADTSAQTVQPLATAPEETACEEVPVTAVECSGCGTAELGRAEAPEPQVTPASVNGISEEQESPQSSGQPEHNGVPLSDSLCLNHAKIEQDVVQPLTVESQSPKIVLNAEAEGSAAFHSEQHVTSIGIRGPSATDRAELLENTQVDPQLPVKDEVIQSKAEELRQSGLVKTATLVVTAEIHATAENTKAAPDRSPQHKPSRESQTKLTLGSPGLKSSSVCECSLDISVAELLPSQENTELQGSPLKKSFTGIGLKKLSGKKHKGKREEYKSGEEVEAIQHLPEQTVSPSKGGRISTRESFKRLITPRKGSNTGMKEKTGDAENTKDMLLTSEMPEDRQSLSSLRVVTRPEDVSRESVRLQKSVLDQSASEDSTKDPLQPPVLREREVGQTMEIPDQRTGQQTCRESEEGRHYLPGEDGKPQNWEDGSCQDGTSFDSPQSQNSVAPKTLNMYQGSMWHSEMPVLENK